MRRSVFTSLVLLLAAGGTATAADRIMVRATSVLPDAVGAELLAIGAPLTITIAPGASVETELQNHCGGSVSNQYRTAFATLNPGSSLLPATSSRDLLFPACARVQRLGAADQPVSPNDSPESFLDRLLGATLETKLLICQPDLPDGKPGSCRVSTVREVIAPQIGRPDGRFDLVDPPVKKLWLPFRSSWTTIVLNPDVKPVDATRRLKAAAAASDAGEGLLEVAPSPPVELLAPLSSTDPRLAEGPCSPGAAVPADWPFDRAEVRKAIEAARAYIASNPDRAGRTSAGVIRVADTGVSNLGQANGFPAAFLAVNPNAKPGANKRDPETGFIDAYYGIDADGGGDVKPRSGDPTGWHGTQVADLALGGVAFRGEYPALAKLVNLSVARLFTDLGEAGIWVNGATLNSSVTYNPPAADIVNFSVGGPDALQAFHDVLAQLFEHRQLVVLAAGNDGNDLGDRPMYPAVYSSEDRIRTALLVVGAHGPAPPGGMPARVAFSNYGLNYVDLLAPGCRLPPAFGAATGGDLAGTSFAAPLVTFTAGLIHDFLFQPQSRTIRERFWASVRWVSKDVADTTRFGGVLDIPAAIRVFDDVARLRGGALTPGRWLAPSRFKPCTDYNALPAASVLRVRVEPRDNAPPLLHLLWRDANALVTEAPACTAADDNGPRLLLETGEVKPLHWSELEAFIPAVDADNRRIPDAGSGGPKLAAAEGSATRPVGPETAPTAARPARPGAAPTAASTVAQAVIPAAAQIVEPAATQIVEPAATPAGRVTNQQIAQIQAALKAIGQDVTPDGVTGPATRVAIREYQRKLFEAPTGMLNAKQLGALLDKAHASAPQ